MVFSSMAMAHPSFSFCVVFSVWRVAVEVPSASTTKVKVRSPSDFVHVRVPSASTPQLQSSSLSSRLANAFAT